MRNVIMGGDHPVVIQGMTKTDTRDVVSTLDQVRRLKLAGCEVVRVAVPDDEAVEAFARLRRSTDLPLVADIHFNYRLAIKSLDAGADKLRINPGNIGGKKRLLEVVKAAGERKVPIRIGVNSGSLDRRLLAKYGRPSAEALVESCLEHIGLMEDAGFLDIVISVKSADVMTTVTAYRDLSEKVVYPLHLGVTEAGTEWRGTIRSAVGIGTLLAEGIGDTLRVSLTADPVREVLVGREILVSLGLRRDSAIVISCPTCGRCEGDVKGIAERVEESVSNFQRPIRVAVMGCPVNGPGEAREADVGLAIAKNGGLIFKEGKVVRRVSPEEMLDALMSEVNSLERGEEPTAADQEPPRPDGEPPRAGNSR